VGINGSINDFYRFHEWLLKALSSLFAGSTLQPNERTLVAGSDETP